MPLSDLFHRFPADRNHKNPFSVVESQQEFAPHRKKLSWRVLVSSIFLISLFLATAVSISALGKMQTLFSRAASQQCTGTGCKSASKSSKSEPAPVPQKKENPIKVVQPPVSQNNTVPAADKKEVAQITTSNDTPPKAPPSVNTTPIKQTNQSGPAAEPQPNASDKAPQPLTPNVKDESNVQTPGNKNDKNTGNPVQDPPVATPNKNNVETPSETKEVKPTPKPVKNNSVEVDDKKNTNSGSFISDSATNNSKDTPSDPAESKSLAATSSPQPSSAPKGATEKRLQTTLLDNGRPCSSSAQCLSGNCTLNINRTGSICIGTARDQVNLTTDDSHFLGSCRSNAQEICLAGWRSAPECPGDEWDQKCFGLIVLNSSVTGESDMPSSQNSNTRPKQLNEMCTAGAGGDNCEEGLVCQFSSAMRTTICQRSPVIAQLPTICETDSQCEQGLICRHDLATRENRCQSPLGMSFEYESLQDETSTTRSMLRLNNSSMICPTGSLCVCGYGSMINQVVRGGSETTQLCGSTQLPNREPVDPVTEIAGFTDALDMSLELLSETDPLEVGVRNLYYAMVIRYGEEIANQYITGVVDGTASDIVGRYVGSCMGGLDSDCLLSAAALGGTSVAAAGVTVGVASAVPGVISGANTAAHGIAATYMNTSITAYVQTNLAVSSAAGAAGAVALSVVRVVPGAAQAVSFIDDVAAFQLPISIGSNPLTIGDSARLFGQVLVGAEVARSSYETGLPLDVLAAANTYADMINPDSGWDSVYDEFLGGSFSVGFGDAAPGLEAVTDPFSFYARQLQQSSPQY